MKDYVISKISPERKYWSSQYGEMVTYFIRIEGEGDEAIQLNKKVDSPAPEEGQELYGEIAETQFGKRFKGAKKPFNTNGGGGYQKSPAEQDNIARAVALKGAIDFVDKTEQGDEAVSSLLKVADELLVWLKDEKPALEPQNSSKDKEKARDWESVGKYKDGTDAELSKNMDETANEEADSRDVSFLDG